LRGALGPPWLINPLIGNCLARRNNYSNYFLKLEEHGSIIYNLYFICHEKQKQHFALLFFFLHLVLTVLFSYFLGKINRNNIIKSCMCLVFLIHALKRKRTVSAVSTLHVCHWVLITAVKLLLIDFISDTIVQNRSSHCTCRDVR